jgi:hypothetical protein
LSSAGCITVATSYGAQTSVERQLLGAYEELDRDLVEASSVRGDVATPPGSYESLKALAIEGRALEAFNQDDLVELEDKGCIGEAKDATVKALPCVFADGAGEDATRAARTRARVVDEENRARRSILAWAAHAFARAEGRQTPAPEDFAEIRGTYHRLQRERARAGQRFETEPGTFREIAK